MTTLFKRESYVADPVVKASQRFQLLRTPYDRDQAAWARERKRTALRRTLRGCPPWHAGFSDNRRKRKQQIRQMRGYTRIESLFGEEETIASRIRQRTNYLAYRTVFERWLDQKPELQAALQISHKTYCSTEYHFAGCTQVLSLCLAYQYEHYALTVAVERNGECFDALACFDTYPVRTVGGFYAQGSEAEEIYSSLEELWIAEAFIYFKKWYEDSFLKADSLMLYGSSGFSCALLEKPNPKRERDPWFESKFIASFPINRNA